jgi:hypothetical protein
VTQLDAGMMVLEIATAILTPEEDSKLLLELCESAEGDPADKHHRSSDQEKRENYAKE